MITYSVTLYQQYLSDTTVPLPTLTELEPYKYAGYPMLIKTITMETEDDQLFSKASPLLPAAAELAFHTVNCSALNAEELRRENGIEVFTFLGSLKYQHP